MKRSRRWRPVTGLLATAALVLGLALAAPYTGGAGAGPRASCGELQRALERLQQELAALQRRALADGKLDPAEAQALAKKTKELRALSARLQACLGGGGTTPPTPPSTPGGAKPEKPAALPRGTAAARLARTLVKARSLAAAEAATRQALAWGGVTVRLGKRVDARGRGPSGAVAATPLEALHLAAEARERESVERLTLAELARMLRGLGFPFHRGDAGAQLASFLGQWIAKARARPGDPRSFTPLFLAEMARFQRPAVDLTRPFRPEELRLTLLEGELVTAAFLRGPALPGRKPQAATVSEAGPCSEVKELVEKEVPYLGEIAQSELQEVVQGQLRTLLEKATRSAIDEKDFGKAMQAAEIALLLQKLVALYGAVAIEVYADADSVHKPTDRPNVKSTREQRFEAVVGLTAADWEQYKRRVGSFGAEAERILRALKDCLSAAGVPSLTDLGDIADEVEKWRVRWELQASPSHARLNLGKSKFDFPGQRKHKLERRNAHSGHAFLVIDVQPEQESDHPGRLEHAQAVACAQVDFSQPPATGTFIGAAAGGLGLAKSIVELAVGWLQALTGPSACEEIEITYHVPACPPSASPTRSIAGAASCHTKQPPLSPNERTFVVTVGGQQTVSWQAEQQLACGTQSGSGTDSYRFATPPVRVRISWSEELGTASIPLPRGGMDLAQVTITRSARASLGCPPKPAPTSGCGTRRSRATVQLQYLRRDAVSLILADDTSGFEPCPAYLLASAPAWDFQGDGPDFAITLPPRLLRAARSTIVLRRPFSFVVRDDDPSASSTSSESVNGSWWLRLTPLTWLR